MTNFEEKLKKLEEEIKKIKTRNKKVEIDKAWETSYFRRILLMVFTYLSIVFYMRAIDIDKP